MKLYIIMGVSGCGKTTLGKALARELGAMFLDADDFHSPSAVSKMSSGIPLDDQDRWPWLQRINTEISRILIDHDCVLACSALTEEYRQVLTERISNYKLIYIKGSYELIMKRIQDRDSHFMNPVLLASQFKTLEEPVDAISLDAEDEIADKLNQIIQKINMPSDE